MAEQQPIYRCGWCGWPCNADGSSAIGTRWTSDANRYLAKHKGAVEKKVNGDCCPNGNGERDDER